MTLNRDEINEAIDRWEVLRDLSVPTKEEFREQVHLAIKLIPALVRERRLGIEGVRGAGQEVIKNLKRALDQSRDMPAE